MGNTTRPSRAAEEGIVPQARSRDWRDCSERRSHSRVYHRPLRRPRCGGSGGFWAPRNQEEPNKTELKQPDGSKTTRESLEGDSYLEMEPLLADEKTIPKKTWQCPKRC